MQYRHCNLISRLAREDTEFSAALARGIRLWTCDFSVSESSWTEVQRLTGLCPLWVMCGRRLGKNFLTLLQHWSGAVMCAACPAKASWGLLGDDWLQG
jgi:hypothetical protein